MTKWKEELEKSKAAFADGKILTAKYHACSAFVEARNIGDQNGITMAQNTRKALAPYQSDENISLAGWEKYLDGMPDYIAKNSREDAYAELESALINAMADEKESIVQRIEQLMKPLILKKQ